VCDVWPGFADVAPHLAHDADVIVAVEEVVLVFALARAATGAVRRLVGLEGCVTQDDDHPLRVLVVARNGGMLLRD
jgi:hypothetical protein